MYGNVSISIVTSRPSSTTVFARREVFRLTSMIKHTNWKTSEMVSSIFL
jgi:hypothetical protein